VISRRVSIGLVAVLGVLAAAGYAAFPHPARHDHGTSIRLPSHEPALDGTWTWPGGVPGWAAGETYHGFPVTFTQPIEVAAAQLAAARDGLDSEHVRVVVASRADRHGVLAILAAPTFYETPVRTCLAGLLRDDAPVSWWCPRPHDRPYVIVATARLDWPGGNDPTYLVGLARGDVERVVLAGRTLYTRGSTWGEFEAARTLPSGAALRVYGHGRLLETVPLRLRPGEQRVFR
jgi:hypothetical protein